MGIDMVKCNMWEKTEWSLVARRRCDVLSGVPQGSVLCANLSILFINDIDDSINSTILKFVEDKNITQAV